MDEAARRADADVSDQPAAGPSHRETGAGALATITISLVVWPIAFNLGAYRAVFYEDVFRFVVAATAAFLVFATIPSAQGSRPWLKLAALAAPAVWFAGAVALFESTAQAASDPIYGLLALLAAVVAAPTALWLLMDLFVPELARVRERRLLVSAIGVIALVAITGLLVGANNDAFLTCDDFKVAGADQPSNCASGG